MLAALLLPTSLKAQDVEARFAEDIQKNAEITAINCDFTQTRCVSVLASEVSKSGKFSFRRPGDISLDFNDGDFIHMSGENFEIRSDGRTSAVKVNSNPMLKELKRVLSSCMSGDVETIMAGFDTQVSETAKTYSLVLTPKNKRAGSMMKSMEMEFAKSDMSLNWMKMTEASDDYTKYTFTNKKFTR